MRCDRGGFPKTLFRNSWCGANGTLRVSVGFSGGRRLWVTERDLALHALLCGPTGTGKSKLMEIILLQLALAGRGFLLIDKDDQTAAHLTARLNEAQDAFCPLRLYDIYYLKPSTHMTFCFDPFATMLTGRQYDAWISRCVESVGRILGRKQGIANYKEQMRRLRVLTDILHMVGTRGRDGTHLGLHRALDALNMGNDRWEQLFNGVADNLPRTIACDLWRLHRTNARSRWDETESTYNILRSFLSPLVSEMFRPQAGALNPLECVRRNSIVVAPLGETPYFSREQGDACTAMLIDSFTEACWFARKRFYIAVEEAETVLGEDLGMMLARARKRRCSLLLSIQDLSGLRSAFADLRSKGLSQPGVQFTFQQKTDLDEWADFHATGSLDLSLNWKPMDRPDGYEWHQLVEPSHSCGFQQTWSRGESTTFTDGSTWNESAGVSETDGHREVVNRTTSRGTAHGTSFATNESHGHSSGESTRKIAPDRKDRVKSSGTTASSGITQGESEQETESESDGFSVGRDHQTGTQRTQGTGVSSSRAQGDTYTDGSSRTVQESWSLRSIPLARHREEWYPSGLLHAIEAQYANVKKVLRSLGNRDILLSVRNKPSVLCKVHRLPDPFCNLPTFGEESTQRFIAWTWENHSCFFVPAETEKWTVPSPRKTANSSNGSTTHKRWQ